MIEPKSWIEFKDAGLLWWVNRTLHLFGWAIVFQYDEAGVLDRIYPARCRFRGFTESVESDGFERLTNHIADRLPLLLEDLDA